MDTPGHHGLHQGPEVLVLHGPLAQEVVVGEPGPVRAEGHALVLQVALPALVADGAVQGVVHQQELHHALTGLTGEVGLGLHLPAVHHGHGAGRHRLGGLLHLDETHPAVARDGESVVVTEPGDLNTNHGGRLEHCGARVHQDLVEVRS